HSPANACATFIRHSTFYARHAAATHAAPALGTGRSLALAAAVLQLFKNPGAGLCAAALADAGRDSSAHTAAPRRPHIPACRRPAAAKRLGQ
nr:hypothetical protein [Tanacetum cinerariifolium]